LVLAQFHDVERYEKSNEIWASIMKGYYNLLVLLAFELIITSICHCFMICCIIVKQDVEILRGAVQLNRDAGLSYTS